MTPNTNEKFTQKGCRKAGFLNLRNVLSADELKSRTRRDGKIFPDFVATSFGFVPTARVSCKERISISHIGFALILSYAAKRHGNSREHC